MPIERYTSNMDAFNEKLIELPDADLYLFGRGKARQAYRLFGCHKLEAGEIPANEDLYRFVVWASPRWFVTGKK